MFEFQHWGELIFFSFVAAIIIVPQVLRSMDRRRMYETLRAAYEHGQTVPPEVLDAMTRRPRSQGYPPPEMEALSRGVAPTAATLAALQPTQDRDLRRGVILLSIGVGLALIGVAFYAGLYEVGGAPETLASFAAAGAVPVCIGLAYLGLWWFGGRAKPKA